jgi:drug/metabolite transporter, DME family
MIGELAALGAALSWTVSALLYKKALERTKPVSANIIRLSCTSGVLLVLLLVIGKLWVLWDLPVQIAALAVVSGLIGLGLGDTLYLVSLRMIGVARAVPLTCTYPLFNLLWAVFLIGEPLTLSAVLGAVVIVLGIWLLSYEKESAAQGIRRSVLLKGVSAALLAAVLWSVSITMMNLAVQEAPDLDHALIINAIRVAAVGGVLLGFSPVIDRKLGFLRVDRKTLLALVAGGIVALGLGWFFLTYSFVLTLETRAVPISSTTPLFSTLAGIALLHEKITARTALGSIIIVLGVFLIFLV